MTFSDSIQTLTAVRLALGCSEAEDVVETAKKLVREHAALTAAAKASGKALAASQSCERGTDVPDPGGDHD